MVTVARELMVDKLKAQSIAEAREAAQSIIGVVVMGPAEERAVEDVLRLIPSAKRLAREGFDEVCALPNAVIDAARDVMMDATSVLDAAMKQGKDAVLAYRTRERQRQEREAREAQHAADLAAAAEAKRLRESAAPGEEVLEPPPVLVPKPVVPKNTNAPTTTRLCFELYDAQKCDPTHLKLDDTAVRAWGQYQETLQASRFPVGKENAVVKNGIRLWREPGLSIRGAR